MRLLGIYSNGFSSEERGLLPLLRLARQLRGHGHNGIGDERCVLRAFAGASVLLSACAAMDSSPAVMLSTPVPIATADLSEDPAPTASTRASSTPTPAATPQSIYVSESGGWSISVPPGWELTLSYGENISLSRAGAIAEVMVSPSWGIGLEQLEARTVQDLNVWPEAIDVEAEVVRLPAGEAVWATLEMSSPEHGPLVFILYAMDDVDHHYAISVRGPGDGVDLQPVAKALAESFAIND